MVSSYEKAGAKMTIYGSLAEILCYPAPGRLQALEQTVEKLPAGEAKARLQKFLSSIQKMSLAAWEELYTRTWDLAPLVAPYVGYQTWGESYQRGRFMAGLNRAMIELNIDNAGELPDHLIPILNYLELAQAPLPELFEVLPPAIQKMQVALQKADPKNPYRFILDAISKSILISDRQPAVAQTEPIGIIASRDLVQQE